MTSMKILLAFVMGLWLMASYTVAGENQASISVPYSALVAMKGVK